MALSFKNKNFLSVLRKLEIDLKQFPDKTFDSLFDNVPEIANYFFNWFIDNISPDNALTPLEQANYFELEKNQLLPTDDELDYVLSSNEPSFEELQSVTVNYVKCFILENLEGAKKHHTGLSDISSILENSECDIKKKQNSLTENISHWKKQLNTEREHCHSINLSIGSKFDDIKMFLLMEPYVKIDFESYKYLSSVEENNFDVFTNNKFLKNQLNTSPNFELLSKLEEDLLCVENFFMLSQGSLKEKKAKIEVLFEILYGKSIQKSFDGNFSLNLFPLTVGGEFDMIKPLEEIKMLEKQLNERLKISCHFDIKKVLDTYLIEKTDLNKSFISKLTTSRDFMKSNSLTDSWFLHIIVEAVDCLERLLRLRNKIMSRLVELERICSSDIAGIELRNQRFKEVSSRTVQHPFLMALKEESNIDENVGNNNENLTKITELLDQANYDCNFATHRFRIDTQSSIKSLFNNVLYGPTNQLLFTPVDLMIKFQNCQEREVELSQEIKRFATKYVDAKEAISKRDRKRLLLWIDFLLDRNSSRRKIKTLQEES